MAMNSGMSVVHQKFGPGTIELNKGLTALVRFDHGIEECLQSELDHIKSIDDALRNRSFDNPREVLARSQALAIRSVNDNWGVFSKSRISLLPHQLWVCHRVLRRWPTQHLIADDVGLGKTIEAGLILWPLLAKKRVRRLLVLTPASLVEQWQERLRKMFDIRLTLYTPSTDTARSDYWNTHDQVVASLPTLRKDLNGRHERMLCAEDWDLLIVDEAHHLNTLEDHGATQGYRFVQKLIENKKFKSKIFFTATPHRGKDYGFYGLLKLLRPDIFDPNKDPNLQRSAVGEVVIRNNKQNVTDMNGTKLFKPVSVTPRTYCFSPDEQAFYDQLTRFIITGQAYASSLTSSNQRAVQLVLIAMQKLAASSVAAIQSAILRRIQRLSDSRAQLEDMESERQALLKNLGDYDRDVIIPELDDKYVALEAELAAASLKVLLMENELPMLQELLVLADAVNEETKITTILDILNAEFKDRTVVFFTEYKSTQALLINTLHDAFGHGCVSFINGDERVEGIRSQQGKVTSISMNRYDAAKSFVTGEVRFIVCTEAGGEGIDLQNNCHSMIHVDLPWNPMRLHQRIGRLNRYGQTERVDVFTLRNPDTVESRIWDLLNQKIENVMRDLGSAMDEPEDLLQLILGMAESNIFNELFSGGVSRKGERLKEWFDTKAQTFGGVGAVEQVKSLVGHADKFEYQDLEDVPKLDLQDLLSFFENMLKLNGRRLDIQDGVMSFTTPEEWLTQYGIKRKYSNLVFDRKVGMQSEVVDVLGVGHPIFGNALAQAELFHGCLAVARKLQNPLMVFLIRDRITSVKANSSLSVIGVSASSNGLSVLSDEKLIRLMGELSEAMPKSKDVHIEPIDIGDLDQTIASGKTFVNTRIEELGFAYEVPEAELISVLVPEMS